MKLAALALAVVLSPVLVAGCGSDPSCADVDGLQRKLDAMSPDDPEFNTTNEKLNRAQADCNA
jgi:hypothetical protein